MAKKRSKREPLSCERIELVVLELSKARAMTASACASWRRASAARR